MADKKVTLEKLAAMSQEEFLGIREDIADIRDIMATKQELAAVRNDLKAAIDSSAGRVVSEIKEFMQPHVKSVDDALVDIEHLKERIKI